MVSWVMVFFLYFEINIIKSNYNMGLETWITEIVLKINIYNMMLMGDIATSISGGAIFGSKLERCEYSFYFIVPEPCSPTKIPVSRFRWWYSNFRVDEFNTCKDRFSFNSNLTEKSLVHGYNFHY